MNDLHRCHEALEEAQEELQLTNRSLIDIAKERDECFRDYIELQAYTKSLMAAAQQTIELVTNHQDEHGHFYYHGLSVLQTILGQVPEFK